MIHWHMRGVVPSFKTAENIAHANTLGLPFVGCAERPPLAVCGGGPSIEARFQDVKAWQGDVWLIGSAFRWWSECGIDGTFFSIHPSPLGVENAVGVKRAIVGTCSDPALFESLREQGADVQVFDVGGMNGGTSATSVPYLALKMGYREITFFGCEGNFDTTTHLYKNDDSAAKWNLRVSCAGKSFLTCAELLKQSEYLSTMIRTAPHVYKQKSGGLLEAMVNIYDITHISRYLANDLGVAA